MEPLDEPASKCARLAYDVSTVALSPPASPAGPQPEPWDSDDEKIDLAYCYCCFKHCPFHMVLPVLLHPMGAATGIFCMPCLAAQKTYTVKGQGNCGSCGIPGDKCLGGKFVVKDCYMFDAIDGLMLCDRCWAEVKAA